MGGSPLEIEETLAVEGTGVTSARRGTTENTGGTAEVGKEIAMPGKGVGLIAGKEISGI